MIELLISDNIPSRRDPHPLTPKDDGNDQQRKGPENCREATKRNQKPILLNPLRNKKGPSKWDQPPENADHDEAVTRQLIVRVDELEEKISNISSRNSRKGEQEKQLT